MEPPRRSLSDSAWTEDRSEFLRVGVKPPAGLFRIAPQRPDEILALDQLADERSRAVATVETQQGDRIHGKRPPKPNPKPESHHAVIPLAPLSPALNPIFTKQQSTAR